MMKTKLFARTINFVKYLNSRKREDHPLFPGVSVSSLKKCYDSSNKDIKTIHQNWGGCSYEITLRETTNQKYITPGSISIITGITLPRYPENPVAADLVSRLFEQMLNYSSDYISMPQGVDRPYLVKRSFFKRSPAIHVEAKEYSTGESLSYEQQIARLNVTARIIITSYIDHQQGLLGLLEEIDKNYPTSLDETVTFVREHKLPPHINNLKNIYKSPDPLSDIRYANFVPPCGGTAVFPKLILSCLDHEVNDLFNDWGFQKEVEPELEKHPVKQRFLVINGVLQRDPSDTSEKDFMTNELPRLILQYKDRFQAYQERKKKSKS